MQSHVKQIHFPNFKKKLLFYRFSEDSNLEIIIVTNQFLKKRIIMINHLILKSSKEINFLSQVTLLDCIKFLNNYLFNYPLKLLISIVLNHFFLNFLYKLFLLFS